MHSSFEDRVEIYLSRVEKVLTPPEFSKQGFSSKQFGLLW